jgi:hypothetical protein
VIAEKAYSLTEALFHYICVIKGTPGQLLKTDNRDLGKEDSGYPFLRKSAGGAGWLLRSQEV